MHDKEKSIEEEVLEERKEKEIEEVEIDVISPNSKRSYTKRFKNLNIKYKKDKKKYLVLLSSLLLMLALTVGSSYAYLTYISKTESTSKIEAGTLALEFKNEQNSIMLDKALPQTDNDALSNNKEYSFDVENTGSLRATYQITLNNTCDTAKTYTINGENVKPDKCIPNDYIKVGLKIGDNDYKILEVDEKTNTFILDAGALEAKEIKQYKMKVWLDIDTPNDYNANEGLNIMYSGKLGLSYEQGRNNLDQSGANEPVLSENMIAVYYDEEESTWRKADSTNTIYEYKWYDYNEKMWANSVTVSETNRQMYLSSKPGTAINMDDILTMQVWIPRYKYKVFNYNLDATTTSNPQSIEIAFENEKETTGEIKCTDSISGTAGNTSETCMVKETSATCTNDTCNGKTYTHPAFTFGEDELTGFWVGKFENSHDGTCTPTDYESPNTGCNVTTMNVKVVPNVTSWRGIQTGTSYTNIMKMNDANNMYGFLENKDDTHMMKNMEWGSIAYLSHSKYGKNTELEMNTNSSYITGCGPQEEGSVTVTTECSAYSTALGQASSTTGNIYGIYDMSGGAWEQMMSNMVSPNGAFMSGSHNLSTGTTPYPNSGFDGVLYDSGSYTIYDGLYDAPQSPYYEKYSFGATRNDAAARKRSKLGDAIREVYNTGTSGWYSDYSNLATSNYPWINRGGSLGDGASAGVFSSDDVNGVARVIHTSRLVISQPNS